MIKYSINYCFYINVMMLTPIYKLYSLSRSSNNSYLIIYLPLIFLLSTSFYNSLNMMYSWIYLILNMWS